MHATHFLAYLAVPLVYHVAGVASSMQRLPAAGVQVPEAGRRQLLAADTGSSDIALQHQEYFYLGNAASPSNPLVSLAGMTNSSETRLLSTERFANTIAHMSCSSSQVDIQFTSASSFQAARNEWQWVTDNELNLIILVTGDSGCVAAPTPNAGSSGSQQDETYAITQATFTSNDLTVSLIGRPAILGELLNGQWTIKGSSSGIVSQGLQARWSESGSFGLTEEVHIPNLFNDKVAGPVNVSLDATLSSTGSLNWDVDIDGWDLEHSSVSLTTTDVTFTLTPQLSLSGSVDAIPAVSSDTQEIPLGTSFNKLGVEFGFFLVVGAQATLGQVSGAIDASIDLELALSDGSLSFGGGDSPPNSGFAPTFSVHSPEISGHVSLTSSIGPTVGIVLQATLASLGVKGGIQLIAPEADLTLSAEASSAGSCGTSDALGLEIDVGIGAELDAIFVAGDVAKDSTSTFKIYSTSTPVFSTCTAIGSSGGTTTNSPTTTTTTTESSESTMTSVGLSTGPTTTPTITSSTGTAVSGTTGLPVTLSTSSDIWSNTTSSY